MRFGDVGHVKHVNDKAGADLVSLTEIIDTTTAAMAVKRANGQRVGTVPYGFDLADDGITLVENTTEQAVIADIVTMRRRGKTLKKIAGELTERKVATKTGKSAAWTH